MASAVGNVLRVNDAQFNAAVETLGRFVAIPSVSNTGSPDYNAQHLEDGANFVADQLLALGFTVRTVSVNQSPLFVLAERITQATKPTILMYGHYDVQPVDRSHWNTDPFVMVERDDRLYGRGASDDKAGIVVITSALKVLIDAAKDSAYNLKVLFEGEEEFGSNNMGALLAQEAKNLAADALIVLDGGNKDIDTGTIENSTRGVLTMALKVQALTQPTHSGVGCLAPDPAQALAGLIHSLRDPRAIPHFMDGVVPANEAEIRLLNAGSQTEAAYRTEHGVVAGARLRGNPNESIYLRILQEPSISVLNMTCGQPNGGNSIQSSAECTVGFRLTAGQDPARVEQVVRAHLESQPVMYNLPFTFMRAGLSASAWKTDASRPYATKYLQAMGQSYPRTAVMPTGGTIPLFQDFQTAFPRMEMFIVGVEDPATAAHSHNESQSTVVFRRAIDSLVAFLSN
jgi:acetylornithine deacetylase/succinyl-diaminopimelate desuccinylase-like protein